MNHKSFVFFDCECANTFDGVGKICSLGYVICDDDLNIIESEDVVMNPECDFDWYILSASGVSTPILAVGSTPFLARGRIISFTSS